MPKVAPELKPLAVSKITKNGLHAVGGVAGLYLQVKGPTSRSWLLRVKVGEKRKEIGLGGYPTVSLADARSKAREFRKEIAEGRDPLYERTIAKQALISSQKRRITFDEAALQLIASKRHAWRNPKHAGQWSSTLSNYAKPVIGTLDVSEIGLADVLQVLEPIWQTKTETASRLRSRIEAVLDWAAVRGHRSAENPARWKGNLDKVLPNPNKVRNIRHHPALPWDSVGNLMNALSKKETSSSAALQFLILTAARSSEVRGMTWTEVDLENQIWTVPKERMKGFREHYVPLSEQSLHILKGQLPQRTLSAQMLVFPSPQKFRELTDTSLRKALFAIVPNGASIHGMRSTFRDWAGETTNHPREVIEHALAHHIPDKAEAAYARGTLLQKRVLLMQDWADHCSSQGANADD